MRIFLDDERNPEDIGLDPKEWIIVRDALTAWQAIRNGVVTHLSLDHDLGMDQNQEWLAPTGYDLCKWMAENDKWPTVAVYVHTRNPVGRANMVATIERYFKPKG